MDGRFPSSGFSKTPAVDKILYHYRSIRRHDCVNIQELIDRTEAALPSKGRLYSTINSLNITIWTIDETWTIVESQGALEIMTD